MESGWEQYWDESGCWKEGCRYKGRACRLAPLKVLYFDNSFIDPFATRPAVIRQSSPASSTSSTASQAPGAWAANTESTTSTPPATATAPLTATTVPHEANPQPISYHRSDSNSSASSPTFSATRSNSTLDFFSRSMESLDAHHEAHQIPSSTLSHSSYSSSQSQLSSRSSSPPKKPVQLRLRTFDWC